MVFLLVAASDYDCLGKMNGASLDKYKEMQHKLEGVNNSVRSMNESNRRSFIFLFQHVFLFV